MFIYFKFFSYLIFIKVNLKMKKKWKNQDEIVVQI